MSNDSTDDSSDDKVREVRQAVYLIFKNVYFHPKKKKRYQLTRLQIVAFRTSHVDVCDVVSSY